MSVRILGTKAARFRSSMHLDSVSNLLPLLFPGASWTREAFLDLRVELEDVDLISRALMLARTALQPGETPRFLSTL